MAQALSLKYRPLTFNDLIGQDSVTQTLSIALSMNKVSHAYLFSGLRGSGKTSSARIFARALQCEKFPTSSPCNECDSCKSALGGYHMDIIEMDAASSRGIDDIKQLIEQIAYKPAYGRFKIFIIDEIHMLTKEAFNALLKTLEEPPESVKFILATTDPLKLPATILSRTQHFRFKKIPQKIIAEHLKNILRKENVGFEDEAVELLSRNCGGSLRDAITMLEQAIIYSKENVTLGNVASMLGALNPSIIEEFFESIFNKNEEKIRDILGQFELYECENVLDEMVNFLKQRLFMRAYNVITINRFFLVINEAKSLLAMNADSEFVLLLTTMKFQEALNIQEIDKLIANLEGEIEHKIIESKPKTESSVLKTESSTESSVETKTESSAPKIEPKSESKSESSDLAKFSRLCEKISERNYEIGEIFAKFVSFVSFKDNVLTWQSRAQDSDKNALRDAYEAIFELAKEIFGKDIKIKSAPSAESKSSSEEKIIETIQKTFNTEAPKISQA